MIEIEVYENDLNIDMARKAVRCPKCGFMARCMYITPSFCVKCDTDLVDALGLIMGMDVFKEKMLFHKGDDRQLVSRRRRPIYLTGRYD